MCCGSYLSIAVSLLRRCDKAFLLLGTEDMVLFCGGQGK